MEYNQYTQQQQQQRNQHSYANSAGANPVASSTSHNLNSHGAQASPVIPQQTQGAPSQAHNMYQSQYGVQQPMHYDMPQIQAAAMAATAAASGSNYPYMSSDPGLPQRSPTMGGVNAKTDKRGLRSPSQMNNVSQMANQRQIIGSPGLPGAQPMMGHVARPGVPPPGGMGHAQMQHPQSPEIATGPVEESPLYVNAKQFHRILKRRVARQKLEEQLRLTSKGRKPYLHESRHNHAMRRPRGPGGRFLTATESAALERDAKLEAGGEGGAAAKEEGAGEVSGDKAGTKRKSEAGLSPPNKKAKTDSKHLLQGKREA